MKRLHLNGISSGEESRSKTGVCRMFITSTCGVCAGSGCVVIACIDACSIMFYAGSKSRRRCALCGCIPDEGKIMKPNQRLSLEVFVFHSIVLNDESRICADHVYTKSEQQHVKHRIIAPPDGEQARKARRLTEKRRRSSGAIGAPCTDPGGRPPTPMQDIRVEITDDAVVDRLRHLQKCTRAVVMDTHSVRDEDSE